MVANHMMLLVCLHTFQATQTQLIDFLEPFGELEIVLDDVDEVGTRKEASEGGCLRIP